MVKARTVERVERGINQFYSTRSALVHPQMCSPTIDGAIEAAKRKLENNGEEDIYIVKIVKIVRRFRPVPEFEVVDVR